MTLLVTTADAAPVSVVVTPAGWVRWERRTKSKIGNLERDGIGYEDMAVLAYESLPPTERPATFDAFVEQLVDIEPGEISQARPTSPGASAVS